LTEQRPTLVWFRSDLRLADNPALAAAVERGGPVIPVFIWVPDEEAPWQPGGARRWWLHESLAALRRSLEDHGLRLVLRQGDTLEQLNKIIHSCGADAVYWNRRYEPAVIARDKRIKHALRDAGHEARSFNSHLLYEPWMVSTNAGGPYKVFTPFWKSCQALPEPDAPCDTPKLTAALAPSRWPASDDLDELGLRPSIPWYTQMADFWQPGEAGAQSRLRAFLDDAVRDYKDQRDIPAEDGTSRLSPHLCHGEISPRQVWHAVRRFMDDGRRNLTASQEKQCWAYLREIGWREFGYHVLYHFPDTPQEPLQEKYAGFPWRDDADQLRAWQRGRTGYPLIDAGMRQLWQLGWMHNRVRMVVASFLVKDLLISWEQGAAWFWDTLVDADLANNTLGWQWAGGCGADAAPYFRVFNPTTQSEKFDPDGRYIRRFVSELADLDARLIHAPASAGGKCGQAPLLGDADYPEPIVDHKAARNRALDALDRVR